MRFSFIGSGKNFFMNCAILLVGKRQVEYALVIVIIRPRHCSMIAQVPRIRHHGIETLGKMMMTKVVHSFTRVGAQDARHKKLILLVFRREQLEKNALGGFSSCFRIKS